MSEHEAVNAESRDCNEKICADYMYNPVYHIINSKLLLLVYGVHYAAGDDLYIHEYRAKHERDNKTACGFVSIHEQA